MYLLTYLLTYISRRTRTYLILESHALRGPEYFKRHVIYNQHKLIIYCYTIITSNSGSSSSRNEYYLGSIIALLLQDHHTMSTKSVCSNQYMVTDQHWATGAQIKHSTLSDRIRERRPEQNSIQFSAEDGKRRQKKEAVQISCAHSMLRCCFHRVSALEQILAWRLCLGLGLGPVIHSHTLAFEHVSIASIFIISINMRISHGSHVDIFLFRFIINPLTNQIWQ